MINAIYELVFKKPTPPPNKFKWGLALVALKNVPFLHVSVSTWSGIVKHHHLSQLSNFYILPSLFETSVARKNSSMLYV
jgi:hypothetical protein